MNPSAAVKEVAGQTLVAWALHQARMRYALDAEFPGMVVYWDYDWRNALARRWPS